MLFAGKISQSSNQPEIRDEIELRSSRRQPSMGVQEGIRQPEDNQSRCLQGHCLMQLEEGRQGAFSPANMSSEQLLNTMHNPLAFLLPHDE